MEFILQLMIERVNKSLVKNEVEKEPIKEDCQEKLKLILKAQG